MPSNPKDISRRVFFQRVATYGAGVAIINGVGESLAAATKVSQKSVSYQTQPKDSQHCDACNNFQPPNACKMVDGEINPQGWCSLFAKKT